MHSEQTTNSTDSLIIFCSQIDPKYDIPPTAMVLTYDTISLISGKKPTVQLPTCRCSESSNNRPGVESRITDSREGKEKREREKKREGRVKKRMMLKAIMLINQ